MKHGMMSANVDFEGMLEEFRRVSRAQATRRVKTEGRTLVRQQRRALTRVEHGPSGTGVDVTEERGRPCADLPALQIGRTTTSTRVETGRCAVPGSQHYHVITHFALHPDLKLNASTASIED